MSSTISITLNSKTDVFFPNSEVHGTLQFSSNTNDTVKQINVAIIGCARTYFEDLRYYGSDVYDNIPFTAEQFFMNYNIILWQNKINSSTRSGEINNQFPFKFGIPSNAPSNISEEYGELQYYIKGCVEFFGGKTITEYYGFSVCSFIDLNLDPKLKLPVYTTVEKTKKTFFFCTPKSLTVTMSLPKTGYVCGEIIPLQINISNQTSMKIKSIEYGISLKCSYSGNCEAIKFYRNSETLNKDESLNVVIHSVEPTSTSAIYNILVPALSPSNHECSIIKLQYYVFTSPTMPAKHVEPSSYPSILSKMKNKPEFNFLYPIVKLEVDKLNTGTRLDVFEYTEIINQKEEQYYLALKYHQYSNLIVIGNCSYLNGEFERAAIIELFLIAKEKLLAESLFETVLPDGSEHEFNKLMAAEGTHPHKPLYQNTYVYYIEEKNQKEFLEKEIALPDGFEVRSVTPEFSKQMMSVLLHYIDGDELQAAIRLKELPSAGIFEISTNKLVAFEYNDGIGTIAHQYVYPEYRSKGLGKAVEILVCQKNLRELDILPSKCVALARPKVMAITEKTKYWSKLLDANGNPSEIWWTIYSKTPKDKIIIRDN